MWRNSRLMAAVLVVVGCAAGADAASERTSRSADDASADSSPSTARVNPGDAVSDGAVRFTVAASGNRARYRVREQLMGRDLPNDAIGETDQVTGAIVIDSAGAVVRSQSRFVVTTAGLKSDSDRRDGYVRRRLLETEQYPTVALVPTSVRGLPPRLLAPDAAPGPVSLELTADLTIREVTRSTTWRVSARQSGGQVAGSASTKFTFADFGITPPRVPIVLSVADTIHLEYEFTLTREGGSP